MLISQSEIALLYFYSLVLGAVLGLFYDIVRVLRQLKDTGVPQADEKVNSHSKKKKLSWAQFRRQFSDFWFCIFAFLAIIVLFYETAHLRFRLPALALVPAGIVCYRLSASAYIYRKLLWLLALQKRFLHRLTGFILKPFVCILAKMKQKVLDFYRKHRKKHEVRSRRRYTGIQFKTLEKIALEYLCGDTEQKSRRE